MTTFAWLSANEFGLSLLDAVVALKDPAIDIVGVITLKPDAKTVMYDGVAPDAWTRSGVDVFYIDRIESDGADVLRDLAPDYVVMAGWRQIVPQEILDLPKRGFVSFHPTALPWGRGPAPLINQILAGATESAMSFMYTDDGVDSGDLIGQAPFTIADDEHAEDVYAKVVAGGVALGVAHLPELARGTAPRTVQDADAAYVFPKPRRANVIVLDEPIDATFRRIRALSRPYRGAYVKDADGNKLIVWRARRTDSPTGTRVTAELPLAGQTPTDLYFSDGTHHLQVVEGEIQTA